MGALVGFVVGYHFGTKAGQKGFEELRRAWESVRSSEELRSVVQGGLLLVAGSIEEGRGIAGIVGRQLNRRLQEAMAQRRRSGMTRVV